MVIPIPILCSRSSSSSTESRAEVITVSICSPRLGGGWVIPDRLTDFIGQSRMLIYLGGGGGSCLLVAWVGERVEGRISRTMTNEETSVCSSNPSGSRHQTFKNERYH